MNQEGASQSSIIETTFRQWRTMCLTFAVTMILTTALVAAHKDNYAAAAHILLINDQAGRDPADVGLDMPTIVMSTAVLDDVKHKLRLRDSIPQLKKDVVARVAPRSSIMTIASQYHNPQIAVDLPNAVADSFVRLYSKLSNSRYDEVTRRLQADLNHKRRLIIRLESQLERASSGASYVGSQASLDASAAHLALLRQSRGEAYAQLIGDRASLQFNRDESAKLSGTVQHEILMNNALYRQSEIQVSKDVAAFTATRAGVKASYPGIAGFRDKVKHEGAALQQLGTMALHLPDAYSPTQAGEFVATDKVLAASIGDAAKLSDLNEQIRLTEAALFVGPNVRQSIGALRAERDAAEAQFQALALRVTAAEANSAESSSLGQVVVVDRAMKADATLISRPLLFTLGVIVAVTLAISSAFLAEIMVPRLIATGDVQRVYGRATLITLRESP